MKRIAHYACQCGEGPLWHPDQNALYWFDIPLGRLFRYDAGADTHAMVYDGGTAGTGRIGATTLQADGSLLLLGDGCRVDRYDTETGEVTPVLEPIDGESRFNDAWVDPHGRIYSGSIIRGTWEKGEPGRLYRIDPDGTRTILDEGFDCPNGAALASDGTSFYFTSTTDGKLYRYTYDGSSGALTDRQTVFDEEGSMPDGMTIDTEDRLWSARWGHQKIVVHRTPGGEPIHHEAMPTETASSLCFGGADLDEVYITTAKGNGDLDNPNTDDAGALFRTTFELDGRRVRGVPDNRSLLHL